MKRTSFGELIRQGIMRARLAGKRIGAQPKYHQQVIDMILKLNGKKIAIREIARRLDIPYPTVRNIIAREICKRLKSES